ncbi:hypothetical protein [Cesiribacter sp. SM1]|uniref:hypothetical protein n=1 Tax=Cesiribacter sp. SM1 TaxID=2861196 RepID=UPI001CD4FF7D|nr:hypothetical protein [Cesiribacter sp. SM1]
MCQKIKIKNCIHCFESFEAKRKNHRYCSASCRVMACYKRKGYTYVSGHYQKAIHPVINAIGAESLYPTPMPAPSMPSQVPAQNVLQETAPPQTNGMTGSGIMESMVGAGAVALGEYFAFYQPMLVQMKEMRQMLNAMGLKLNAIQQDRQTNPLMSFSGIQPIDQQPPIIKGGNPPTQGIKPQKEPPLTPHQLTIQRLGLDPNKYGK